ncbi:hypothetical protein PR048_010886 [Dryococelus australis]|uniref:Uncharacterized protein n=1 Tax=Dryococelus australis TaxID=614101 RepID=A0ABQ9I511_9NEOP|nr:hypothetical protein PR048_010886 [Dryococelus australis]
MRHTDLFPTKELEESIVNRKKNVDGRNDNWLQMRWLRYEKSCALRLKYKSTLNHDVEFDEINLAKAGKGRAALSLPKHEELLFTQLRAETEAKKRDMLDLLPSIPPVYHPFFKHLPTVLNIRQSHLARDAGGEISYD